MNHEKPRTWKYAKSVKGPDDEQIIRVGMRGTRKLDASTELTFKYQLTGAPAIDIELRAGGKPIPGGQATLIAHNDTWSDGITRFKLTGKETADEIVFRTKKGSVLFVDDVLLYTPGE